MQKLYVIHGWTYDASPWLRVARYLKQSNIQMELLLVPGLTASSSKTWTILDYVTWANNIIPENAIVLGHSNGGRILLNLINLYPKKLKALILLDSAGIYEKSIKRKLLKIIAKILAPFKKISILRRVFHRLIGASDYSKATKHMKQTLQNMIDSDKQLKINSKIPTEIIWGEKDKITPLRQGKQIHRQLKNSKLSVQKNWGHSPYLQDPAALAKLIALKYQDLAL